ncbi:MAG: PqiC family protein [Acidobacteriota bacterium]
MIQRRTLAILLVVLTTGCGFLKRPPNQFYSLEIIAPQGAVASVTGLPIGIDGIELPPGLDRRGIVLRGANHQLEVRGTHQWASPLEDMVLHTLAFDLADRIPLGMMVLPGQSKPSGAMRSLSIVFEDLAPGPDGVFVLDARWTLTAAGAPALTGHERITTPLASTESASVVSAMSATLATLAERIVARM